MPRAVIAYDKDLPEIPGRRPWEKPTSFLVKDDAQKLIQSEFSTNFLIVAPNVIVYGTPTG